jgi:hypothetical protein
MARRGVNPYLIDRSAGYLAESMQRSVTAFDTQMANIEKSKNALTLQDAELKQLSTSISADNENDFKDGLTKAINDEIDRVYKLGYNSIGRDQSEHLRAQSNLLNAVKQLPEGLALLDEENKKYAEAIESGRANYLISNSTNPNARAFEEDMYMNNGNNVIPSYKDGNFILSYGGTPKDQFSINISNYKNARSKGAPGTINYVDDMAPELKTIYSKYSAKYDALVKQITTAKDGVTQTRLYKNYDVLNTQTREDMLNDPNLLAMVNEDAWQFAQGTGFLTDNQGKTLSGPFTGSADQIKQTAEALVDFSMDQYGKENQLTKFIQKPRAQSSTSTKDDKDKDTLNYKDWVRKNLFTANDKYVKTGIYGRVPDKAKVVMYNKLRELNPKNIVFGKDKRVKDYLDAANVDEDAIYFIDQYGRASIIEISDKDVSNEDTLNALLVQYTPKARKSR